MIGNITEGQLLDQFDRADRTWPFIRAVEAQYGLPKFLLFAVGSRETNLQNIHGDWAQRTWAPYFETYPRYHGFGIWQRDSQHGVGEEYLADPYRQAQDAAAMLANLLRVEGGDVRRAANRYNSGQPNDAGTAGGNYGPDVVERLQVLQRNRGGGVNPPVVTTNIKAIQSAVHATPDGIWGPDTNDRTEAIRTLALVSKPSVAQIKHAQGVLGVTQDGVVGPQTFGAWVACVKKIQTALGVFADGIWGPATDAAYRNASPFA